MKSGRFSAAQNKAENGDYVDSVAEIAMMCEKEGFIPRFAVEEPNDKVDYVIRDIQSYLKTLVNDETNLEAMLEKAYKSIEEDKSKEEDEFADEASFDEELFADLGGQTISDQDLLDFKQFEQELGAEDEEASE